MCKCKSVFCVFHKDNGQTVLGKLSCMANAVVVTVNGKPVSLNMSKSFSLHCMVFMHWHKCLLKKDSQTPSPEAEIQQVLDGSGNLHFYQAVLMQMVCGWCSEK